jgi:nucleotide-binding universal stress UspA family protein
MVVEGNAAQVLLHASAGADLLVVRSPGHGGFASTLLGSPASTAPTARTAPVVVIRDDT